jgi:hypothetical protein
LYSFFRGTFVDDIFNTKNGKSHAKTPNSPPNRFSWCLFYPGAGGTADRDLNAASHENPHCNIYSNPRTDPSRDRHA